MGPSSAVPLEKGKKQKGSKKERKIKSLKVKSVHITLGQKFR